MLLLRHTRYQYIATMDNVIEVGVLWPTFIRLALAREKK